MDEKELRELIADVQTLMTWTTDAGALALLKKMERKLGAALPPIRGTLNIDLDSGTLKSR